MPSTAAVTVCTAAAGSSCVTFTNAFDNNAIWRDCSQNIWTPDALATAGNTCVLDPFTNALFCACNATDTCNGANTGSMALFNTNECASNPCGNGTCTDLYGGFVCSCSANFTGANCNTCVPGM